MTQHQSLSIPILLSQFGLDFSRKDTVSIEYAVGLVFITIRNAYSQTIVTSRHRLRSDDTIDPVPFNPKSISLEEREILIRDLVSTGMSQSQIARWLDVSQATISLVMTKKSKKD